MKFLQLISLSGVMALAPTMPAQTTTAVANHSAQAAQAQQTLSQITSTSAAPLISVEPPSLIPANILPGPGAASLPKVPPSPDLNLLNDLFKQTTLGQVADEHRLHVQATLLKERIRNDRQLHELQAAADRAPTDLERRHRLRTYYQTYYGKLGALADAADLKTYLQAQEAAHELVLLQPHVRHETDEKEAALLAKGQVGTAALLPAPRQAPVNNILPRN